MTDSTNVSGWAGWVAFIGILMTIAGFFQGLMGLLAALGGNFFVVDAGSLYLFNAMTWGWIHLLVGILLVIAGLSVLKGNAFGRTIGTILAIISLVGSLALVAATPIWSSIIIVIDVLIIYGLVAKGGQLKSFNG
jgi:hypothetical protein